MFAERAERRGERLQKVLAHAGVGSRRTCEEYILQGRVKVNGEVVVELGTRVHPRVDRVSFDGSPVAVDQERLYYALYKPVGYISTVNDPHGRPVVVDLVPTEERVYPVGRLDMDSEGLLLLTNDGQLTHRLTHPRYEHEKEYLVLIRGRLTAGDLARLEGGIRLKKERPARARVSQPDARWRWQGQNVPHGCNWIRVILHEGRNRQIRRMLDEVEHPVERLVRVRMATLHLGDLQSGEGRWLDDKEIRDLRRFVGLEEEA
ncbi:MAG: pseudouridine synthase [Chloroflexota bacterium]|nr:pseudouridine synthase [Chloroflexota bacterium]